mgnify:CR=1 FL=1
MIFPIFVNLFQQVVHRVDALFAAKELGGYYGPHCYTTWWDITPATCTSKGLRHYVCRNCDYEKTQETSMLPHNYGAWTTLVPASMYSLGLRGHTCQDCGAYEEAEYCADDALYQGVDNRDAVRDMQQKLKRLGLYQGSTDGVAVNDAIISDRGYLLGVVVEVDATSCKVMTILHPSFNAAGVISRTRENGIITGSADYAADGQCVLTNLDRATEARKGDQVITTGLGGVFPANLLVGTVQEVVPEQSGKSSSAVILPGADPRTVKHVFIVTEY